MFKDYYAILEITPNVSFKEIRSAYRKQSMKWHPDRNPNQDTTKMMQNIIEAYIILKDEEARKRYNQTYFKFKKEKYPKTTRVDNSKKNYEFNYNFSDDILKKWMANAKQQAEQLRDEVIDEFKGAIIESGKSILYYFIYIFLPMTLGFLLIKTCHR